ncbi:MAG: hypothetical protein ACM3U2_16695, partial [Deltaproteobacteria bacterium]
MALNLCSKRSLILVGAICTVGGLIVGSSQSQVKQAGFAADESDSPGTPAPKAKAPAPNAKARRDAARRVYDAAMQHRLQVPESAAGDISYLHDWSVRWMQAEKDFGPAKSGLIAA